MGCRVQVSLATRTGVRLGKTSATLRRAGRRTLRLKLGRGARRILSHFHGGTLTVWLHVRSHDGEQQTIGRVIRLRR